MNWTSFKSDLNVSRKKIKTNIQNLSLNSSFDTLSKWHDPHISCKTFPDYQEVCTTVPLLSQNLLSLILKIWIRRQAKSQHDAFVLLDVDFDIFCPKSGHKILLWAARFIFILPKWKQRLMHTFWLSDESQRWFF